MLFSTIQLFRLNELASQPHSVWPVGGWSAWQWQNGVRQQHRAPAHFHQTVRVLLLLAGCCHTVQRPLLNGVVAQTIFHHQFRSSQSQLAVRGVAAAHFFSFLTVGVSYPCAVDIKDLITIEDAMEAYKLGPNGGAHHAPAST